MNSLTVKLFHLEEKALGFQSEYKRIPCNLRVLGEKESCHYLHINVLFSFQKSNFISILMTMQPAIQVSIFLGGGKCILKL